MNLRAASSVSCCSRLLCCWWWWWWWCCCCWLLASYASACPSECSCKWKSGKITAECSDRGLIKIPTGMDADTQVLDISGNDLQVLHRDTFQKASLISLQKMYVRSCRLGQIDKYAFRGLTNLIEIDLSDNLLTHVPSQAFEDVPYLRNVSLARNPIQKVEAFAFRLVPQLMRLDLSHCNIRSVRPKAFDNLNALDYLKLNDNELQELPTDTLQSLKKLRTVELQGNDWICDCHLRAVKTWIGESYVHVPYKVLCGGGPERLKNLSVMELDAEDFACKPAIKTESRRVDATIGANVTLECRVESDPVATIRWFYGGRHTLSNDSIYDDGRRLFIVESDDNVFDKRSTLVLQRVADIDAGSYHCVAENRAGHDEANFTVNAVPPASTLVALSGNNVNVVIVALGFLIVFMLLVIVLLLKRIRYGSAYADDGQQKQRHDRDGVVDDDDDDDDVVKKSKKGAQKNSIDSSSQRSHDSEIKSESGKAFTVTSDLSYSRSLSDIGNATAFSNPDLISGAANVRDSACATPITRPISDYCHNWQKSYAMAPPPPRALSSAAGFGGAAAYDAHDRMPMVVDTMSAGSGSDDVFTHSRMSNDYPPDYGLPILPENEVASQPCAKTLKVWQRGVPVYPPMCATPATLVTPQHPHHPAYPAVAQPNFQTMPHVRHSPADRRYQRCGTDV